MIYKKISSKIYLDTEPPSTDKPEAYINNSLKLVVTCKQKDSGSGIGKILYGYKEKGSSSGYTWKENLNNVKLETNKTYSIKTRATDKTGNTSDSLDIEIDSPVQITRSIPNSPLLATGMKAIVWDGTLTRPGNEIEIDPTTWETSEGVKTTWYNYVLGNNTVDSRNSIWANAKTPDGSYWVWIPSFAYRIIYYTDAERKSIKGYYQNSVAGPGYFLQDGTTSADSPSSVKSKNMKIDLIFLNGGASLAQYKEENLETKVVNVKALPTEYIIHPAFKTKTSDNNSLGSWKNDISGIWVAKFEASRGDATYSSAGISGEIKSVPNVISISNITVSEAYDYSREMYNKIYGISNINNSKSHLIKNSEWGAVAYLAYSAYGRNGNDISSNNSLDYITGGGSSAGSSYTYSKDSFIGEYSYDAMDTGSNKPGMYSSTTGNVYGVYDLVGGTSEFVSSYLESSTSSGSSLVQTSNPELRAVYSAASSGTQLDNYNEHGIDIYGDATFETSVISQNKVSSVGNANSVYPIASKPFIVRGGAVNDSDLGVFVFNSSNGTRNGKYGFRPVIVVEN